MREVTDAVRAGLACAGPSALPERVRAGQCLAPFADVPAAAAALAGLLLDPADTMVTRETAAALARAGSTAALRVLARAVAAADDNHADWLQTGVHDAVHAPGGTPGIERVCGELAGDPDAAVRRGAAAVLAWADGAGR